MRWRSRWGACGLLTVMVLACALVGVARGRDGVIAAGAPVRNGKIAIFTDGYLKVITPDGSGVRRLAGSGAPGLKPCAYPTCFISTFVWSPDGTRLAFVRGNPGSGPGCQKNCRSARGALFVINADGTGERRLSVCIRDCGGTLYDGSTNLSWSPDSSNIVFSPNGLGIVNVASGRVRRLGLSGNNPAWSPDGRSIAYGVGAQLFTTNVLGRPSPRQLTQLPRFSVGSIDWAPDGQTIVFDGPDSIYTVRADGSQLTRLEAGGRGSGPGAPSWSPDGTKILYFNTPGKPGRFTAEVWTMDASGADKTRIVRLNCCVGVWYPPIWSPDGKQIAFAADGRGAVSGTYVSNADGTRLRQLARFPTAIAWQPLP